MVRLEERTYVSESDGLLSVGRPHLTVQRRQKGAEGISEPGERGTLPVLVPLPDFEHETWLEVRHADTGDVVTVLEILSPSNKSIGDEGRRKYESKRMTILGSTAHLVEVDLIRHGEPMRVHGTSQQSGYRILVSRGDRRPRADLLLFSVRDPIPRFQLPLLTPAEEPEVDLGSLLHELYDQASYDFSIDYRAEPLPPLSEDDAQWADRLLHESGHR
jgi:hypothetical protein